MLAVTRFAVPPDRLEGFRAAAGELLALPLLGWGCDEPSAFEVVAGHDVPVPATLGPSARAR